MARKTLFAVALAQLVILLSPAHAIQIVEAFDTDTPDVTDGSYPDFILTLGTGSVSGGVLQLGDGGLQRFTRPGLSGDLSVSGQIQSASYGDWNVGMEFGNRRFVFHPGFEGGLFQIEDAELPTSVLPPLVLLQIPDMGFTPSATAFHTMQLDWNQDLDRLTITVADGDGIADPFHLAWTPDAAFDPNGRIGFVFHNGGGDPGPAFFDNLIIVPESSPALLLSTGLTALAAAKSRGRRQRGRRKHARRLFGDRQGGVLVAGPDRLEATRYRRLISARRSGAEQSRDEMTLDCDPLESEMRAIGRNRSGRVVVVVNSDEPDSDRWEAMIVDVHHKSVGPVGSAKSLFESQSWGEVDSVLGARAIELVREAIAAGSPPPAREKSPVPITDEDVKAIWPEVKNLTGTSGRAIMLVGVSKRTSAESPVGKDD